MADTVQPGMDSSAGVSGQMGLPRHRPGQVGFSSLVAAGYAQATVTASRANHRAGPAIPVPSLSAMPAAPWCGVGPWLLLICSGCWGVT
jgi:hypothetical protein